MVWNDVNKVTALLLFYGFFVASIGSFADAKLRKHSSVQAEAIRNEHSVVHSKYEPITSAAMRHLEDNDVMANNLEDVGAPLTALSPDQETLLSTHNMHRSSTALGDTPGQPMSKDMTMLLWNSDIALAAQTYADKCVWGHDSNRGFVGENIFVTGSSSTINNYGTDAVDKWFSEHSLYTFSSGGCSGVCGHYTQVVWANSLELGCGIAQCNNQILNLPFEIYIVCRYSPPGNFANTKPYTNTNDSTEIASECPSEYTANSSSGLCEISSSGPTPIASPTDAPITTSPTGTPINASPTDAPITTSPTGAPINISPTVVPVTTSPTGAQLSSVRISDFEIKYRTRNRRGESFWKPILEFQVKDLEDASVNDASIMIKYQEGSEQVFDRCVTSRRGTCKITFESYVSDSVASVNVTELSIGSDHGNYNAELNTVYNSNCPIFSSACQFLTISHP